MTSDEKLNAFMCIQLIKSLRKDQEAKIIAYETEMVNLVNVLSCYRYSSFTYETKPEIEARMKYLGMMLGIAQKKVEGWTEQEKAHNKLLKLQE